MYHDVPYRRIYGCTSVYGDVCGTCITLHAGGNALCTPTYSHVYGCNNETTPPCKHMYSSVETCITMYQMCAFCGMCAFLRVYSSVEKCILIC